MEGALLHVVQEIVLLVRGTRGVPAATSAELVEHREGQDHKFLLLLAVEVARTFSDNRACNRDNCRNGGTPHSSGCTCRPGYKGTCCEGGKEKYKWSI